MQMHTHTHTHTHACSPPALPRPSQVAANADVVFVMVGYPVDVREVILHPGPEGGGRCSGRFAGLGGQLPVCLGMSSTPWNGRLGVGLFCVAARADFLAGHVCAPHRRPRQPLFPVACCGRMRNLSDEVSSTHHFVSSMAIFLCCCIHAAGSCLASHHRLGMAPQVAEGKKKVRSPLVNLHRRRLCL